MLKRMFTTTVSYNLSINPCNKCDNFRYIIKGNTISEHCMLYFNFNPQKSDKSANRSLYPVEPEFSKKVRNDETKCGSGGNHFVSITKED
jgi:hypothetical protein